MATTQPLGDRCGPGSPSREPSEQPGVSTDVCLLGMHAQREGGSRGSRGRQRAVGDGCGEERADRERVTRRAVTGPSAPRKGRSVGQIASTPGETRAHNWAGITVGDSESGSGAVSGARPRARPPRSGRASLTHLSTYRFMSFNRFPHHQFRAGRAAPGEHILTVGQLVRNAKLVPLEAGRRTSEGCVSLWV